MDRVHVMQLVRSYQVGQLTRRSFLKQATIAVGSAIAANSLLVACNTTVNENPPPVVDETQPAITATPLTTESNLTTGIVSYGETELMGHLAYTEGGDPRPAIIVLQEWWGLNDHIKDVANRLAEVGYVTLAPDLYHGNVTTEPDEARKFAMELSTDQAVAEIQQAIDYLLTQENVNGNVGIIGFCMGGGLVLQTAVNTPSLNAAIPFYGSPLTPDQAQALTVPTLSFLGSADRIPASGYEAMHAVLDENDIPNQFQLYEGAQHAFFNDTRASSYDADIAKDAWERMLGWFKQYLV